MRRFSAQYIFTNSSLPLKRAVITTDEDGTITGIDDTGGDLKEGQSIEFYNGIIIPGFVNCHCHLELSHLKGKTLSGNGLGNFIRQIRSLRDYSKEVLSVSAKSADNEMYKDGVVLCADICNTSDSFKIKKHSRIRYISLLEVFGIDPDKAEKRMDDLMKVAETARDMNLIYWLVPHSAYSMSLTLLRLLRDKSLKNKVTSIHFMETDGESSFLNDHKGPLALSYEQSGLIPPRLETATNHADVVLNEVTRSGNLILVHNTFADRHTIRIVKERPDLFWCLCPKSNIYIENEIPPVNLLMEEGCDIVIGTDSLASNSKLSILDELKTLQFNFPEIPMETLVGWATMNGARALSQERQFGSIESGKKPGLLLLQNVDLQNMKLLPGSFVTRLI
jgi:aminodeoxyfutalosine deaminase